MEMFQVNVGQDGPSPEQIVHNCDLAEKLWYERVKPENVNLNTWSCGTVACFGGHIAQWPEFLLLQFAHVQEHVPEFLIPGIPYSRSAGYEIFGNDWIFNGRSSCESDTDYSIVLARIAHCRELALENKLGNCDADRWVEP